MKRTLSIVFVFTMLLLQACAGTSAPEEGSGVDASPTTAELSAGGLADLGAQTLDLSDPDNFKELPDNYQVAMDFTFEATGADESPVVSSWRLDGVGQADPPASRYTFSGTGAASIQGSDTFEISMIGDQVYFFTGAMGCVNMTTETAQLPFDTMVDTGGMLTNEVQRVVPDETINGVPAYRYAITQANLDLSDPTALEISEITNGAIYIAKDGGYVLRLALDGRGVSSLLSGQEDLEGEIHYQLDFTPVPSVGEITPPDGCAGATASEFPILPGATNLASFTGFTSYQAAADLETAVSFYKTEMAAAGWTLMEENMMANIGLLRFSLDTRTVSVVLTFEEATGLVSVVIGEE